MVIIFDGDIPEGKSVEIEHNSPGAADGPTKHAYFLNGGEDQASVELEWRVKPLESETFHHAAFEDLQNENLQEGRAFYPELPGSDEIKLVITNEENNSITVKVVHQPYR